MGAKCYPLLFPSQQTIPTPAMPHPFRATLTYTLKFGNRLYLTSTALLAILVCWLNSLNLTNNIILSLLTVLAATPILCKIIDSATRIHADEADEPVPVGIGTLGVAELTQYLAGLILLILPYPLLGQHSFWLACAWTLPLLALLPAIHRSYLDRPSLAAMFAPPALWRAYHDIGHRHYWRSFCVSLLITLLAVFAIMLAVFLLFTLITFVIERHMPDTVFLPIIMFGIALTPLCCCLLALLWALITLYPIFLAQDDAN